MTQPLHPFHHQSLHIISTMKRIAIFGNKSQKTGFDKLARLIELLRTADAHFEIAVQRRYMEFLERTTGLAPDTFPRFETYEGDADLALSIGGDGSFLTTAASVGGYETPILGINSGHLGYLSAAELENPEEIIAEIADDDFIISPRSVIEVEVSGHHKLVRQAALNEVAILKQDTASMITVDTALDGSPLAKYRGDGLIISTPTGSTGYNLSVGGPIMDPTASNWIISPIAPHTLNMRPLVVSDSVVMQCAISSRSDHFLLSVDGKATPLPVDTRVTMRRAGYDVNVIMSRDYNFTETLRAKLLWGIDGI